MHRLRIVVPIAALLLWAPPSEAADRELRTSERYPSAAGKKVVVDVANLDVEARAADLKDIEVATDLRIGGVGQARGDDWITRHTPVVEDSAGRLSITVQPGQGPFMWIGSLTARRRLRLLAPAEVIPDITTTSGDISLRGDFPNARPLFLRTATGQLDLNGATAALDVRSASGDTRIVVFRPLGKLFARTSSGDVVLEGGAREATVDTASGNIRLSNLSGSCDISTSTGKVSLSWDRLDADSTVKVRSSSGRLRLVLPEMVRPRGTLTTTDGTIRCDLPGQVNEAGDTITLQGEGPLLDIETASGDIVLGRSDGWQLAPVSRAGEQ